MMKRYLLLLSFLFMQGLLLVASDRYRVYDVRSGLSENSVLDMFQDEHGYMWFATKDGLNRFNGYTFDVFRKNIDGFNLKIDAILPHKDGRRIWIGSDYRLLLFDPVDETFAEEPALDVVTGVWSLCYGDGSLWVASESGVFRWDGVHKAIRYDFDDIPQETLPRVLMTDSNGNVWLGMGTGIYRYIKESDLFVRYRLPVYQEVTAICEYDEGSLLVGTDHGDVFSFGINMGGTFRTLARLGSRIHDFQMEIGGGRTILIGSDVGLYIYDDENRRISRSNDILDNESIYGFYVDREGALWIGTYFCGVLYRQPKHKEITCYHDDGSSESLHGNAVSDMCEDVRGNIWIATENGGLNYLDVRSQKIRDYTECSFSNIHALCLDGDRLYIGTFSNGMDVLDVRTGHVERYTNDPSDSHTIVNDFVYSIFKSSEGTIYVGTMQGVCTFDPSSGKFSAVRELKDCFICDINEDQRGSIWFADKNNGVYCLSPSGEWNTWTYPILPSNRICSIFVDWSGNVWLCTNGAGVCRYDRQDDTFHVLAEGQDVPGVCYQMLQDEAGFYWVSSNSGLFRFSLNSDKIRFYTVEDGLQSNQFNYNSALKTSDGRLWFGGVNGLNSLDPLNLSENTVSPNVRISSVTTASENVFGKSEKLPFADGMVRIPHDITFFDITFDVLSNIAPGKNRVAYMIDGINDTWNYTSLRTISIVKPASGTYTLRVRACNNDGYWSEKDAILEIEVLPHPLESLPAKIIYLVLSVCLAVLAYKILARNLKRRKEEELRIIELNNERESVQSKMTFFTNVAHEIKTPVTLISAPLDKIIEVGEWNEEVEANLYLMKKNSDRLLNLVKQLLDFRKIEKDSFKLTFSATDVNMIVMETVERFRLMRQDVSMSVELSHESAVLNADAEALVKVVSNLIANAVKYTGDSILVKVSRSDAYEGNAVRISVTDNGPGIPLSQQDRIFDMYYQVNPGKANGFGVGLSLVKHLVELHGGRVYVNGEYRQGCQMVVELPDNVSDSKAKEEERAETDSTDICILVVEDTKDMQDFIVGNMGREFAVLSADNGVAALKVLEEESVDIIISDLYMPEMDGLELLEKVRSIQQISHIPFILLTAQDSVSTKIKSLEYGSDAYIEKPFSLEHLRATVNNLIARRDRVHRSFQTSIEITMDNEHMAGPDSEWLSKVNALILKNISNDTYNVDELAGDMSVSRTVLQRKLKGLTGSTPNDYIRLIRLKKAAEYLSQGGYRVNEVCYLVGFNSPSYFTKCFIQQFGMKPKDFRLSGSQKKV